MDIWLRDVQCNVGASYTSPDTVSQKEMREELCGVHEDGAQVKLLRFEAWLVPFNIPKESLNTKETKWLNEALGGNVDLSSDKACYSTDHFASPVDRSSDKLRAACAGPLKPRDMMVTVSTLSMTAKSWL